jgi:hypothetical protein
VGGRREVAAELWLATRPVGPASSAEQQLRLVFDRQRCEVHYGATVDTSGAAVFHYVLQTPADLVIERVSVREGTADHPVRWAASGPAETTLFLHEAANGPQHIELEGWLSTPDIGSVEMPWVALRSAERVRTSLELHRRPGVLVSLERATGLSPQTAVAAADMPGDARWLGTWASEAAAPDAQVSLTPNEPRGRIVEVVSVTPRSRQAWNLEIALDCQVEQGLVDELRLVWPAAWTALPTSEPAAVVSLRPRTATAGQVLVVRPAAPIADGWQVKLSGELRAADGGRIEVPDLALLYPWSAERWMVLPQSHGQEPFHWETLGLVAALPTEGLSAPSSPEQQSFRVDDPEALATLTPQASNAGRPSVLLADVLVRDGGAQRRGLVRFELDPDGRRQCSLELPEDCKLTGVWLNGRRIEPFAEGNGRKRLALDSTTLPQLVEAAFVAEGAAAGLQAAAPRIADWPVERTLWSHWSGEDLPPPRTAQLSEATWEQQQRWRSEALAKARTIAEQHAAGESTEEMTRWKSPWLAREAALLATPPPAAANSTAARDVTATWLALFDDGRPVLRLAVPDELPKLALVGDNTARFDLAARATAAAAGLLLAGAAALVLHFWRLPAGLGWAVGLMALGLAWWLWLTPSVLGLGIVLAGPALWLFGRRRRGRQRSERESSIVRLRTLDAG